MHVLGCFGEDAFGEGAFEHGFEEEAHDDLEVEVSQFYSSQAQPTVLGALDPFRRLQQASEPGEIRLLRLRCDHNRDLECHGHRLQFR
jgi:hypothetical protein